MDVQSLAQAVAGAATGRASPADLQALSASPFPMATSLRIALPLGAAAADARTLLLSPDLRDISASPALWAVPTERALCGRVLRSGRTAVAEADLCAQHPDTQQLAEREGAASFLAVPVLLEASLLIPRPAVAALLLAYPSAAAAPQEELRVVLLLASELSHRHAKDLAAYSSRLHAALHPGDHAGWGPGVGDDYPELPPSDSEAEEDELRGGLLSPSSSSGASSSGGAGRRGRAAAAAQAAGPLMATARWAMSVLTLRFAEPKLERRFQRWRNVRLARMDATALLCLLLYYIASCLLPPFSTCLPWPGTGLLPALTAAAPLLLLLLDRSHHWFSQHRDQLLACTYVLLACHHTLDMPAYLSAVPPGIWRTLVARVEGAWCVALGVILQVQFAGQLLMLSGGMALRMLLQPACVARLAPGAATDDSLGDCALAVGGLSRALLLNLVLPCGLAYCMELSARRAFCRSVLSPQ